MSKWTLALWVLKCLVELSFLYTCITRRVKVIWVMALYSFTSTLFLMITFDWFPSKFTLFNWWVDLFGTLLMAAIFTSLAGYVIDGEEGYLPVLSAFIGLITSQFICLKLNLCLSPSMWVNRLNILLWILGIFLLSHTSKRFPRSLRSLPVDFMSMTVVSPHQSVLVPHNNQCG